MIGAEKTAGMLTTIFWGGNESRRLSFLPLPGGGESYLHHPFPPPPAPSFADIGLKSLLSHCCYYGECGGGGEEPLECDPLFFAKGYSMLSLFLTILCFVNRNCERGEPSNRWAKKGKTQVRLLVFNCYFFPENSVDSFKAQFLIRVCKPNLEKSQPIRIKKKCYNERMRSLSKLQKCLKTRVTSKQLDRIKCQVSLTSYQVKWIKTNTVLFNNAFDTWWNISIGYNMILTTLTHLMWKVYLGWASLVVL